MTSVFYRSALTAATRRLAAGAVKMPASTLSSAAVRSGRSFPVLRAFSTVDASKLATVVKGAEGTTDYRLHFEADGSAVSPWHDIPLLSTRKDSNGKPLYNFVCEIERGMRQKFEVATEEEGNPIKQDTKKGKLRLYGIDPVFNYGCLPQTWEDPNETHKELQMTGDNDPVDVVEIGEKVVPHGAVIAVKPLAVLCLLDEGEVDWKVIAVSADDPRADLVNDVEDLEKHFPGKVAEVREWFRTYKTHDGKPLNEFGLGEKAMPRAYTETVIEETHQSWKRLMAGAVAKGDLDLTSRQ